MLPRFVKDAYDGCKQGEELICRKKRGALIVTDYLCLTLASKGDRRPAAGQNVAETGSANPTRNGDRSIQIILAAFTSSKRKSTEPGLNIRDGIVSGTLNMFAAMLHSSKNSGRGCGKGNLNL